MSDPRPTSRPRRLLAATLLAAASSAAAGGDPMSTTFQPDVFGTRNALRERTAGLEDPYSRGDCPAPNEPLTLVAAVDIALCRNPATRSAWASAHQQAAALGTAESAWLPIITGTDSESSTHGTHIDATGQTVTSSQSTNDAAVNLRWVLYDFGGRSGRIASAGYVLDAAAATANRSVQETVFDAAQAFYGLSAADAALAAAKSAEEAAARSVEITRALHEGGASALSDVLQAETAFDQAVLTRVQAAQTAKSAIALLDVTLGLPADQPLKLRDETVPDNLPALTARMSDLMNEAMRQRPDLAAALAQRDAAIANITVARAAGRPTISVTAGHEWVDTSSLPQQNYSQIGVQITVPLFSGFRDGYRIRQAQGQLEVREANAEQVRLSVSRDVWNGYWGLQSANQQLTASATLVKTAAENQEVAVGRYQAGVGTILDLLTAQTAAASAAQTRIAAEQSWHVARAQLVLALGRLTGSEPLHAATVP